MSRFVLTASLVFVLLLATPGAASAVSGPSAGGTGASTAAIQYRDGNGNGNGNGNRNDGNGNGDTGVAGVTETSPPPSLDPPGGGLPDIPEGGGVAGGSETSAPEAPVGGSEGRGIETRVIAAERGDGALPFTGSSLLPLLMAGLALLVMGVALHRRARGASAPATAAFS